MPIASTALMYIVGMIMLTFTPCFALPAAEELDLGASLTAEELAQTRGGTNLAFYPAALAFGDGLRGRIPAEASRDALAAGIPPVELNTTRAMQTLSDVLKTRHDTVKNTIQNIR